MNGKGEALRSQIIVFIAVSLQNFMKFYAKMEPKSEPKIDVWAIRGQTFEVLGAFLRGLILD